MDSITAIMMIGTVVFAVLGGITLLSQKYFIYKSIDAYDRF